MLALKTVSPSDTLPVGPTAPEGPISPVETYLTIGLTDPVPETTPASLTVILTVGLLFASINTFNIDSAIICLQL